MAQTAKHNPQTTRQERLSVLAFHVVKAYGEAKKEVSADSGEKPQKNKQ
jgi:hypothetical protein